MKEKELHYKYEISFNKREVYSSQKEQKTLASFNFRLFQPGTNVLL